MELIGPANRLFGGLRSSSGPLHVWMSHGDHVESPPAGWEVLGRSDNSPIAAMGELELHLYGLQFHPEVIHTPQGREILRNFVVEVCGCRPDWTPVAFIEQSVAAIRDQVGSQRVVCGLSGGVDSAVCAELCLRALGKDKVLGLVLPERESNAISAEMQ